MNEKRIVIISAVLAMGSVFAPLSSRAQGGIPAGIPADLIERSVVSRSHELYVSMTELSDAADLTYVDVRDGAGNVSARIPGSLQIPLYSLKTKPFLKSRNVVLVDGGWGNVRLEDETKKLMGRGFASVQILEGGINAWYQSGGELQGAAVAGSMLSKIDAAAFWSTRRFDDWLVVNPSTDSSGAFAAMVPESIRIPFHSGNPEYFKQELGERIEDQGLVRRVLLITHDGNGYTPIRNSISSLPGVTVFCLEGGALELERRLKIIGAMRNSKTMSTTDGATAPAGCATCP